MARALVRVLLVSLIASAVAAAQDNVRSSTPTLATDAPETHHPEAVTAAVRATIAEKTRELASNDPARVAAAAYLLGELGPAAATSVSHLAAVLGDNRKVDATRYRKPPHALRPEMTSPGREAAAALAKIGDPAIEALIGVLKNSPSAIARQNAAWALGIIQNRHSPGAFAQGEVESDLGRIARRMVS